jgi:hypothetical protein
MTFHCVVQTPATTNKIQIRAQCLPNSVVVKCKQTYSLGIVNHILAPCKNGDGTARHIVLNPSEDHCSIFPRVIVGKEREAQVFFRQLKDLCLQYRKSTPKKIFISKK